LWYINRSNGYVQDATGKPVDDYEDPNYTPTIDKIYTTIGGHVMLDTQQVFQQFMPAFQQLIQMAQQRKNAPPQLPPDAQVVMQTSTAETQRKTAKDQADAQIEQARIAMQTQKAQLDNQTKVQIENAKLTHQTIQTLASAQSQAQPVTPAAPAAPVTPDQGDQNVNI